MSESISPRIERLFQEHSGDGEFLLPPASAGYTVIWPKTPAGRFVFSPKPQILAETWHSLGDSTDLGLMGRYGLPAPGDVAWLRQTNSSGEMLFLGDLDPPDLLLFAWLRERLMPVRVEYLGIADRRITNRIASVPESWKIDCTPAELACLEYVDSLLPDWAELVGADCAATFRAGRKIELESIAVAGGQTIFAMCPITPDSY